MSMYLVRYYQNGEWHYGDFVDATNARNAKRTFRLRYQVPRGIRLYAENRGPV